MSLVNKDSALVEAVRLIKKCAVDSGVELLSYKRNRSISLIRISEQEIMLRESGYISEEQTIEISKLSKILKTCIKREFPRSRKIRFFKLKSAADLTRTRQKI